MDASSSKRLLLDIDWHLACKICANRHNEEIIPKVLPCGHTFCQICIVGWVETVRPSVPTCPCCNQSWQIPNGGIENLPTNYEIIGLTDLVTQTLQSEIRKECKDCIRLRKHCYEQQQLLKKYVKDINEKRNDWQNGRRALIEQLESIAATIATHHKNCNIAKLAGATASSVGGILAIIGFGLSFVTFGASLIVAGVGAGVAVAGGSTHIGSTMEELRLSNKNLKEAQQKIDADNEALKELQVLQEKFDEINSSYSDNFKMHYDFKDSARYVVGGGAHVSAMVLGQAATIGRVIGQSAAATVTTGVRAVAGIAVAPLAAFSIGFDIYTFVTVGKDVHNKGKRDGHEKMQTMIRNLTIGLDSEADSESGSSESGSSESGSSESGSTT